MERKKEKQSKAKQKDVFTSYHNRLNKNKAGQQEKIKNKDRTN